MDDTLLMRGFQRFGDLGEERQGFIDGDTSTLYTFAKGLPLY